MVFSLVTSRTCQLQSAEHGLHCKSPCQKHDPFRISSLRSDLILYSWTIREGHTSPDPPLLPYGEIDILETFNDLTHGYMTLHTDTRASYPNCTFIQSHPYQSGELNQGFTSCSAAPGCSTIAPEGSSGTPFNQQGGGVYAMEWTNIFINIYYFARDKIPADINEGKPMPQSWGIPVASFDVRRGDCDLDANFPAQTIVSLLFLFLLFFRAY